MVAENAGIDFMASYRKVAGMTGLKGWVTERAERRVPTPLFCRLEGTSGTPPAFLCRVTKQPRLAVSVEWELKGIGAPGAEPIKQSGVRSVHACPPCGAAARGRLVRLLDSGVRRSS